MKLRLGTRGSRLARAQAKIVADQLEAEGHQVETVVIASRGDATRSIPIQRLGVAGAFTARLEQALVEAEVDLAVHSLKDLPLDPHDGLTLAAILPRGPPADALLVHPEAHAPDQQGLPLVPGARVATSGPRRQSQLLAVREDLTVVSVRGNVDTRLGKLRDGWFDALVMAHVAIGRAALDTSGVLVHLLDPAVFPCAPGQAAIAVQARADGPAARAARALDDATTRAHVEAERCVLGRLGGGCGLPLGTWVRPGQEGTLLTASFASPTWTPGQPPSLTRVTLAGPDPKALAQAAADELAQVQPAPAPAPEHVPLPEEPGVLLVASEPTAAKYEGLLREHGIAAVGVPTRRFAPGPPPDPQMLAHLTEVDWIVVTSPRAVPHLARLLEGELPDATVATTGPATAGALHEAGLPCHLVAPDGTAASMAREIVRLTGQAPGPVLLALGDNARDEAPSILGKAGFELLAWTAYETQPVPVDLDALPIELPAATALVTSPASAQALPLEHPAAIADRFIAMGPTTAQALFAHGVAAHVLARPTPDALLELIR